MTDELEKDLGGSDRCIKVLSQNLPGVIKENHENQS
jgi:hypothetical protein